MLRLHALFLLALLTTAIHCAPSSLPFHPSGGLFVRQLNTSTSALTCNGHASLCNVSYADVVYAGAHNSYAVGDGLSDNQNVNITQGLTRGIRLLQGQGHDYPPVPNNKTNPSGVSLCHTSCLLQNSGALEAWLAQAKAWLDANPRQVLTLLVTNGDNIPIYRWKAGFEHAGFNSSNVFTPKSAQVKRKDWPTLGELIRQGKRTVVFIDRGADHTRAPWILDEFSNMWENPYDQLQLPFNCSRDRGRTADTLYLHNHVKDTSVFDTISIPDKDNLTTVNAAQGANGVIETVQRCTKESRTRPTFVLVDYFDVPSTDNVFTAVDKLNNVTSTPLFAAGHRSFAVKPMFSSKGSASLYAAIVTFVFKSLLVL